jgi:hypothetical protein
MLRCWMRQTLSPEAASPESTYSSIFTEPL